MARAADYFVQHQNVVGDKVRRFRMEQNLSQKELSRQAAELGYAEYSESRLTVIPVTTEEYGISKAKNV